MSAQTFIARVGQSPNFIAFNAHWGFSFFLMAIAAQLYLPIWVAAVPILFVAALKEFWFDMVYETAQTWMDGWLDFAGYSFGVALAAWVLTWRIAL